MITIFFYSLLVLLGMLVVYAKRKDKTEYAVGAGAFEISATVERGHLTLNIDEGLADLIAEVVSLDRILMG